jgi:hypothetical protein
LDFLRPGSSLLESSRFLDDLDDFDGLPDLERLGGFEELDDLGDLAGTLLRDPNSVSSKSPAIRWR